MRKKVEEKENGVDKANTAEFIANPHANIKSTERPRKKTRKPMTTEDYLNAIPEVGGLPNYNVKEGKVTSNIVNNLKTLGRRDQAMSELFSD